MVLPGCRSPEAEDEEALVAVEVEVDDFCVVDEAVSVGSRSIVNPRYVSLAWSLPHVMYVAAGAVGSAVRIAVMQ
jgi:hypothetical protein